MKLARKIQGLLSAQRAIYDLSNAKIITDGNSLTEGILVGINEGYPQQLRDLLNADGHNVILSDIGVGGQETVDMFSDIDTQLPPLFTPGVTNILCAWEMANHLVRGSATEREAVDKMHEYCNRAKELAVIAGVDLYIFGATLMAGWANSYNGDNTVTGYIALDEARKLINSIYRKEYHLSADYLVDVASDVRLGTTGANENEGYVFSSTVRPTSNGIFSDGVHLEPLGYSYVAEHFYRKIKRYASKSSVVQPPAQELDLLTINLATKTTASGNNLVADSSGVSSWGSYVLMNESLVSNTEGFIEINISNIGASYVCTFGFDTTNTNKFRDTYAYAVGFNNSGLIYTYINGTNTSLGVSASIGSKIRVERNGSMNIKLMYASDGVNFTELHDYGVDSSDLYVNANIRDDSGIIYSLRGSGLVTS